MLDALGRLPSLCAGDRSLSRAIAISPFVPTACGKLAAPAHLYDPRIPELVELLDVNNSFPTAPFDDDVTLGILASLGMRSTVTQTAVMDAAMTAERLGDVDGDGYDPVGAAERGLGDSTIPRNKRRDQNAHTGPGQGRQELLRPNVQSEQGRNEGRGHEGAQR
jgi:hypothetical protein